MRKMMKVKVADAYSGRCLLLHAWKSRFEQSDGWEWLTDSQRKKIERFFGSENAYHCKVYTAADNEFYTYYTDGKDVEVQQFSAVVEATHRLARHRRIPAYMACLTFRDDTMTLDYGEEAKHIFALLGEPVPEATEEQMDELAGLLDKPYNSQEREDLEGLRMNTYQAACLIADLRHIDDLLYSMDFSNPRLAKDFDGEIYELVRLIREDNGL